MSPVEKEILIYELKNCFKGMDREHLRHLADCSGLYIYKTVYFKRIIELGTAEETRSVTLSYLFGRLRRAKRWELVGALYQILEREPNEEILGNLIKMREDLLQAGRELGYV